MKLNQALNAVREFLDEDRRHRERHRDAIKKVLRKLKAKEKQLAFGRGKPVIEVINDERLKLFAGNHAVQVAQHQAFHPPTNAWFVWCVH